VLFIGADGTDKISINDGEHARSVEYQITPTTFTSTSRPDLPERVFAQLAYDHTAETVAMLGSEAANRIRVIPSRTTQFDIDGNTPASGVVPPRLGDSLYLDFTEVEGQLLTMASEIPGSGAWQFANGFRPVNFRSIERFNEYLMPVQSGRGASSTSNVKVFDAISGWLKFEIPAEILVDGPNLFGMKAIMGDLTGDGLSDLIVSPAEGVRGTEISIFDGNDGNRVRQFNPYPELGQASTGVALAYGDIDGDGWEDLTVGPAFASGSLSATPRPIRSFSGNPARIMQQIGTDLWPYGNGVAAGFELVISDQHVYGNANRGYLFVGTDIGGVSTIQAFSLQQGGDWARVTGSQIQPFGSTGTGIPHLSVGDADGDNVDDLFVTIPHDPEGRVKIFSGRAPFRQISNGNESIPQSNPSNAVGVTPVDGNGDGIIDMVTTYRSDEGTISMAYQRTLDGSPLGQFITQSEDFKNLTGFWTLNGNAAYITTTRQQAGSSIFDITVEYSNGTIHRGTLSGTTSFSTTLPPEPNAQMQPILGQIQPDNSIKWLNGSIWRRLSLSGSYSMNGSIVRVQQQHKQIRIWNAAGELFAASIDHDGILSATHGDATGRFGFEKMEISLSDGKLWRRMHLQGRYTDAFSNVLELFESVDGRLYAQDHLGRITLVETLAEKTIRLNDWSVVLSLADNQLLDDSTGKTWTRDSR
jgi:hypothetical protein